MAKDRIQQIRNILSDFGEGFSDDYGVGREDRRNAYLRDRKLSGQTEESTKWDSLMGTHPCLLYTSPSPRDRTRSRMPSSS